MSPFLSRSPLFSFPYTLVYFFLHVAVKIFDNIAIIIENVSFKDGELVRLTSKFCSLISNAKW